MKNIRYKHTRVFTSDWTDDLEWVAPGAMCVLVGHCDENAPTSKMWYTMQRGTGGVSGNLDWSGITAGEEQQTTSANTPTGFARFWRSM